MHLRLIYANVFIVAFPRVWRPSSSLQWPPSCVWGSRRSIAWTAPRPTGLRWSAATKYGRASGCAPGVHTPGIPTRSTTGIPRASSWLLKLPGVFFVYLGHRKYEGTWGRAVSGPPQTVVVATRSTVTALPCTRDATRTDTFCMG